MNEPHIFWKDLDNNILVTTPTWNEIIVDIGIRKFLKEINRRDIIVSWTKHNRIQEMWKQEIENQDNFSWKTVWTHSKVGKAPITSFKQLKERSFRMNLMHDELSTL